MNKGLRSVDIEAVLGIFFCVDSISLLVDDFSPAGLRGKFEDGEYVVFDTYQSNEVVPSSN